MDNTNSREGLRVITSYIEKQSAVGPPAPLRAFYDRFAANSGMSVSEFVRAVSVEIRLQALEKKMDLSGLTNSHIRELRRIQPEKSETIDEVARKAVVDSLSVRALRTLVDDKIRGHSALAPTAREAAFREAIDFERSAFAFVATNKALFADARAMLVPQTRGSDVAVDFVLQDGTGVLVAFECKHLRKSPQPRQTLDLVAAHALFARKVEQVFAVFSAADAVSPKAYRHLVETFALERLHTLTLGFDAQATNLCHYRIHRRAAEGWHETEGQGSFAREA